MLYPEWWNVGSVLVARWLYVGILIFSSVDPLGVGIRNADIVVFGAVVGGYEKRQKAARIAARLIVYFLCCGCDF